MAKDNNNINTDELTGGPTSSSSGKAVPSTESAGDAVSGETPGSSSPAPQPAAAVPQTSSTIEPAPRKEENPFSFKHFLKWDGNHPTNGGGASSGSINHSRSTSNINGHGSSSLDGAGCSNGTNGSPFDGRLHVNTTSTGSSEGCNAGSNITCTSTATSMSTATGSPSKSATTSSLNVVSSTTGARPKIPQFQSVNTLSSESKMKRSPRFPSFDSQSSLSDFADDRFGSQIYQSRSNGSFNSDYPTGSTGAGGQREDVNGMERLGEQMELLRGYVQRSYSNYDLESPGSSAVGPDRRNETEMNPDPPGRLVGATEFSAALPDFVQDHLVMEQWYNTLPKGSGGGSGSSGSADFEDMLDLTGMGSAAPSGPSLPPGNDIPFDLTASSTTGGGRVRDRGTCEPNAGHRLGVRLDLPRPSGVGPEHDFDLPPRSPTPSSSELPPDLTEGNAGGLGESGDAGGGPGGRARSYHYPSPPGSVSGSGNADKIHRLPDFLSDGPIHSSGRLADVTHDTPYPYEQIAAAQAAATERRYIRLQRARDAQYQSRISTEVTQKERLRRELDVCRQTVGDQAYRIRELERDLETMVKQTKQQQGVSAQQQRDGGGSTQSNANSFLQAKKKAATAEAEVKQLRKKINSMNAKMELLRRDNERLREEVCDGAIGGSMGAGAGARMWSDEGNLGRSRREDRYSTFLDSQTIALRQAASTAESNLRQLLSGVENLRTMANHIEAFRGARNDVDPISLEEYMPDLGVSSNHGVDVNDDDDDDDDVDDVGDDDEPFGPAL